MLRILGTLFAALAGLAFGSFLNVCLSRWPEGESVVHPRSHCRTCNRTLTWWENIPVLSWLVLRGRCRTCETKIHWRYPLVEGTVATLWALIGWQSYVAFFPLEFAAGRMLFVWLLVALAALDAEHLWLPDFLTLPGIGIGLVWWLVQGEQIGWALHIPEAPWEHIKPIGQRLLGILAAAAIILLIRWTYWLIRRKEGIGLGDAKLMALLAAWLGLPGALLAFFLGVVLGAFYAIPLLATKRTASAKLPLGTFLCIGGIVSALWGQSILAAYLHWAGF